MIVATNATPKIVGLAVRPVRTLAGPIDWIDDLTDWVDFFSPSPEAIEQFVKETLVKAVSGFFSQKLQTVVTIYLLGRKGLVEIKRFVFDSDDPDAIGAVSEALAGAGGVLPTGVTVVDTAAEREWAERMFGAQFQPGGVGVIVYGEHSYGDP